MTMQGFFFDVKSSLLSSAAISASVLGAVIVSTSHLRPHKQKSNIARERTRKVERIEKRSGSAREITKHINQRKKHWHAQMKEKCTDQGYKEALRAHFRRIPSHTNSNGQGPATVRTSTYTHTKMQDSRAGWWWRPDVATQGLLPMSGATMPGLVFRV